MVEHKARFNKDMIIEIIPNISENVSMFFIYIKQYGDFSKQIYHMSQ